ncbi:hypothetical protein GM418_08865 [Maribellus comscasis]|uniref:Uncharacterized protein n=1 Tax=Maribellus comscasis TaxID=2681766 RepID=A0A6I6K1F8_9BACT|nr:hypothetical protein [Maribellus comscasis]QGY43764.1 hypothetical protein GM418_08865 [Maribellus comscasis]
MEQSVRLIHKTCTSYLATILPVNFYGLPDGHIYLIYSRFYEISFQRSGLEFVFAKHEEFTYDFAGQRLFFINSEGQKRLAFYEMVDKPNPHIKIIKILRNLSSYNEAQKVLIETASAMIESVTPDNQEETD